MSEQTPAQVVAASEHPDDRVGKTNTLYSVSAWTIFWRNFLAGVARSIGSILIYLFFFSIVSYFSFQLIWPQIQPFVKSYQQLLEMMTGSTSSGTAPTDTATPQSSFPSININPEQLDALAQNPQIQELMQQMQNQPTPSTN